MTHLTSTKYWAYLFQGSYWSSFDDSSTCWLREAHDMTGTYQNQGPRTTSPMTVVGLNTMTLSVDRMTELLRSSTFPTLVTCAILAPFFSFAELLGPHIDCFAGLHMLNRQCWLRYALVARRSVDRGQGLSGFANPRGSHVCRMLHYSIVSPMRGLINVSSLC